MRRVFKKCVAVALAAAMVVTLAPASADAAKKPSLKKKASVTKGKTVTLKLKNGNKKAKVTWKSSKAKVAKITKQVKKGNKASAKVKGIKKGTAKITATYKLGKKKTKLTCKVTVNNAKKPVVTNAPATTTAPAPAATTPATAATTAPTATATPKVTGTPRPTPTPSARPKNTNLDAYGLGKDADGKETVITVDGKVDTAWEDSVANDLLTDITKESGIRGGESKVTAAKASIMWGEKKAYVLVDVTKANADDKDSVTIYFDENAKATKDTVKSVTVKAGEEGKSTKTATGYIVEAEFDIATAKEAGATASIEIQINEDKVTTNYYDTRSAMVYNEETKAFELGDAEVAVATKPELLGQLTLVKSMAQSTLAYYTAAGDALRAEAKIDEGEWDVPAGEDGVQAVTAKKVTFVDTKYWTDAYGDNPPIKFPNSNLSSTNGGTAYAPDGRGSTNVSLMKKVETGVDEEGNPTYEYVTDPDLAKAYIIWDEDYLYVLFDIKDPDITPASATGGEEYLTDSTEFFLDEDNSKPSSYTAGGDEIQIRVAPADNSFSSEENAITGSYKLVAHASKVTEGVGYQVQYIIQLNNKHKNGDIMGMDLQVNDCENISIEGTDDEGNTTTTPSTARACTITAYDTTNNAYADPSCFGRVKLIDPNAKEEDSKPGDDTQNPEVTGPALEVSSTAITVTKENVVSNDWYFIKADAYTENADGNLSFTLPKEQNKATSLAFNLDKSGLDLTGAKKMEVIVEADVAGVQIRTAIDTSSDFKVGTVLGGNVDNAAVKTVTVVGENKIVIDLSKATAETLGYGLFIQNMGWASPSDVKLTLKSIKISE